MRMNEKIVADSSSHGRLADARQTKSMGGTPMRRNWAHRLFLFFGLTAVVFTAALQSKPKAPTLADLWDGKAHWVVDAENVGSDFHMHYPSIINVDKELWAYYIVGYKNERGEDHTGVARARSTDGVKWTNDGVVLEAGPAGAWDSTMASFPGIWKDGDTFYLVYEGSGGSPGDVGLATSKDGKTFTRDPANPILKHETTGWEHINIGTPSLYRENGMWYLFYHGYDAATCQIGVASGKDLHALTKSASNPIVPAAPNKEDWESGTTGRRSQVVKDGDYYYFAYEGSTLPPYTLAKWGSGMARTKSLTGAWEKCPKNPVIPLTPGGMGNDGPEMIQIDGKWSLYIRLPGNLTTRYRLELFK